MKVNIRVTMRSGKVYDLVEVEGSLIEIQRKVNKYKFIRFGPLVLNCLEIESILED